MKRSTLRLGFLFATSVVVAAGCIGTQDPPEATLARAVPFGPRIYLADHTGQGAFVGDCAKAGPAEPIIMTSSTSSTATVTDVLVFGNVVEGPAEASYGWGFNCYVEVFPGELQVEVIEASNQQFQLCVDSDVCQNPEPADVDKSTVCSTEEGFDSCPVVKVGYEEALRYCEFMGRRLPSGIEHVVMRHGIDNPQTGDAVKPYPNRPDIDDPPSSCNEAVIGGTDQCGLANPMTTGANPSGAASNDVNPARDGDIYDLIGNASEWAVDLLPLRPNGFESLPWFCERPLTVTASIGAPVCPSGEACVMGNRVIGTELFEDIPICVASPVLVTTNGFQAAVFGANFDTDRPLDSQDEEANKVSFGTFARFEPTESVIEDGSPTFGVRCVGAQGGDEPAKNFYTANDALGSGPLTYDEVVLQANVDEMSIFADPDSPGARIPAERIGHVIPRYAP